MGSTLSDNYTGPKLQNLIPKNIRGSPTLSAFTKFTWIF